MSEVRLVLRDADREISGTCHGSTADRIIAALSAEPETIEELEAACARFERPSEHRPLAWFRPGVNDEPYDAGLVVIDLAARLSRGQLRRVRRMLHRAEDWQKLIDSIRQKYGNRPRFMEILDKLEGKTILQSQRAGQRHARR